MTTVSKTAHPSETSLLSHEQVSALRLPAKHWLRYISLAAVVTLAAVLRFANLTALGYANHYYTAAVASMMQSWHNFFFAAAEPGGAVSVDKPPVGLWLQVISASIFGLNSVGVLLPQVIAGILSVIVVYAPVNLTGLQINQALLAYLEQHTQDTKYLMAVPSAMQGADYVIATGQPVLYLGGFMGTDEVETADGLADMVALGELRYIYWDGRGGPGFGQQSTITNWVTQNCVPVQGFDTQTQNSGAPDGTRPNTAPGDGFGGGFGALRVSLYACNVDS